METVPRNTQVIKKKQKMSIRCTKITRLRRKKDRGYKLGTDEKNTMKYKETDKKQEERWHMRGRRRPSIERLGMTR